jgi:predicted Zn-dependent protease
MFSWLAAGRVVQDCHIGRFIMTIRRFASAFVIGAFLLPAGVVAQIRGEARMSGKIVDDKGQPLADVSVVGTKTGESETVTTRSNKKGDWSLNRLAAGEWVVEFSKDGYEPTKGTVKLGEQSNVQKVDVTLAPKAADPNAEIQAELKRGEAMMKASQFVDARKVYEDLLAKYPSVIQLNRFIAATYAGEKNYAKATEHLRLILEKEPENLETKILLADLLIEGGNNEEGLTLLRSVDLTQVKDPYPFINGAITLIRDSKPDEAITLLNSLLAQFPNQAEIYYYRGRAYIAAKKLPEGKADLEKFVAAAAPDARELGDAKKILEQLKDIK